jgi:hypothetical protein
VANAALSAAPPSVTYLYPAGAKRGTTVEVTAAGTFERWPVQVWASDKAITGQAAKEKGKLSITVAADAVPGVHWLRLHDGHGASNLRPFLVGTLPEVMEKEPNDEVPAAQVLEASAVVNGKLAKAGDVDCFAIVLKKGQTLVASLEAHNTLRSPMDAVLQIVSADGFVLEQNNDWSGLDPQIVYPATKDGKYIARLFAFPSSPDASIRFSGGDAYVYRLTLTTGGFLDHTVPLAANRGSARVTAEGWNIPAEAKTLSPTVSGDEGIAFHSGVANSFRVKLEDHPCFTIKPAEPIAPPFSLTGRLTKNDTPETVRIAGKKGQALTLRVDSRGLGLLVNPVIVVRDEVGKQIVRAEPPNINKDTTLTFTPTADGVYRVEVHDLHELSGPRHAFRLRVAPAEPGFDLTLAGDRFALTPGKPLDIPVAIVRSGGFAKEIELAAEGLPAGVKVEVLPPPKGEVKSITLRLTAEKAGPSGPLRIVGRSKDPALARTAVAPLAEFETTTSDLWLAVGGDAPAAIPKKKR